MKTSKKNFVRKIKEEKQWLEFTETLKEDLGITKQDLETNSPFIVIQRVQDILNRYGITEDELCKILTDFAKEGFAKSGVLVHRHTNEKLIIMKINSEFVNNDEKATEFLKTFTRRDHGIR